MEKSKSSNSLRPLHPDIHGTGRWTFSGKNLAPYEVERLTAKGLNWAMDVMPDGRLKLPKFRSDVKNKRAYGFAAMAVELQQEAQDYWEAYQNLPEPRPDYLEWAAQQDRRRQFERLRLYAFTSKRESDRIKAMGLLLEFSKSKPKQQLELSQKEEQLPVRDLESMFRILAAELKIPQDTVDALIAQNKSATVS